MHPCEDRKNPTDFGPHPFTVNITCAARENDCYRRALWTGCNLQATLMSIPPCGETGQEMHDDADQMLYIVQGSGKLFMGFGSCCMPFCKEVKECDAIFVPAGCWHNLKNTGRCSLKLFSVYAPPHHSRGTMQFDKPKEDSESEE